jgi:hypothetical protein
MMTTPKEIDAPVIDFCKSVNANTDPVFVPVKPVDGGTHGECNVNVTKQIEDAGGTIEYGWAIWLEPGLLIEAEHHSLWVSPEGERIDVTPHEGEDRIVFLPGANPFGKRPDPNIRRGLSNNPKLARWINVKGRLEQLVVDNTMPDGRVAFTPEMLALQAQADQLGAEIMGMAPPMPETTESIPALRRATGRSFRGVGRNDPCPCGSGKKYKKCCMRK